MNIIHIEDFFHPNAGYQINILPKYMVKQGHTVTIVTSKMDKMPPNLTAFFGSEEIEKYDREYSEKTGVDIIRLDIHKFISGRAVFTKEIFRTVEALRPDILYVHGNDTLTAMRYLFRLNKIDYPIVMDSHMLEMASINRFSQLYRKFYKYFFTPIIIRNKIPVIRTQDDSYVEKNLGIPLHQCPWISVGSDTLFFYPDERVKNEFRKSNNIEEDDFVVVYTGKLDESKGGKLLAQAFEKKFVSKKNIVLIVVGNTNGEYGKQVEYLFNKSENRIIRFPTQKYTELAKFYQVADLSVFPKQCSLSFYDAQACGLPVVSEANNINIDRVKYNNGFTFKVEDVDDFRCKILNCIEMPEKEYVELKQNSYKYVKENYDYIDISEKYMDIIVEEYGNFKNSQFITTRRKSSDKL